ncbi:uncharacterized protein [Bemisia tabaci]|uniref:uncharacterized protein isoform X2 n=1 Tax=Bemisia tabaci TaxID=7038 RepID=UPI0008F9C878|nr:PREDICTED: splicing factor, arginine/serine-rich 15 isoform X2 [Bemisia tabaci]
MEAVKQFNSELQSLYETKPPISKAKMTSITKTAIKAIKFYKHVVQSVEKFIQRCKPEYKVPGLYVIDSIVRQSRHQFGSEKDVFAPRFARNIVQTFVHLFNCPVEDKSKVIRVLNLWQKNAVFGPDVIQPLFDLADPNHPMHKEQAAAAASNGVTASLKTPPSASKSGSQNKPSPIKNDTSLWVHETTNTLSKQIQFDKKLLDFDYGEEEDDGGNTSSNQQSAAPGAVVDSLGSILSNPEVLRQLQNLQAHLSQAQLQKDQVDVEEKMRRLQEMKQQEEEFDRHLAQTVPKLPFAAECDFKPGAGEAATAAMQQLLLQQQQQQAAMSAFLDGQSSATVANDQNDRDERRIFQNPVEIIDLEKSESPHESHDSRSRRRRRSRSRSRNRSGARSRSRSHSRSKRRRSRSHDRDRDWREDKEYDREKERERKKKGLPSIRKNHLSVCSTTLWIGHLSKLVQQEDLSDTFGEFGDIVSIDLIPPRGCAFICMNRRQDANKALIELKYHKLHGKTITLAWAPGKGMKGKEWKDFWEVELGVSYIPWNKLSADTDFELLEEGGMFDEETMPLWMKDKLAELNEAKKKEKNQNGQKGTILDHLSQEASMEDMMNVTPSEIPIPGPTHPGFIPLPEALPPTSNIGDIKPPMSVGLQMPPGPVVSQSESGIQQIPTHMTPMGIMSPFGMPRLLGMMGPGMLGNVPLGVPPPGILGSPMMLNRMPQPVGTSFNPQTGVLSQIPLPSAADKQKASLAPPGGTDGFGDGLLQLPFGLPPHLRMQQGSMDSSLLGPPISGSMEIKVDKPEEKPNSEQNKPLLHNFDIPPPNMGGLFSTDLSVPPPLVNNLMPSGDSDQRIPSDGGEFENKDKDNRKQDKEKDDGKDGDRRKDRDHRNSSRDKENKDKDYRDRRERDYRSRDRDYREKDREYRGRDRDREHDRDRDRDFRFRDGRNDRGIDRDTRDRDSRDNRDSRNSRDRYNKRDRDDDRRPRSRDRRDKPSRWSKDDERHSNRREPDPGNENDRSLGNPEVMPIGERDNSARRDKSPSHEGTNLMTPGVSEDSDERDLRGHPPGGPPGNIPISHSLGGPPPNGGPPSRHPLLGLPSGPEIFGLHGPGPEGLNFRPPHSNDKFDCPPLDALPPDFCPPLKDFEEFDPRDADFPMRDRPGFDPQRHPPGRGPFEGPIDDFGQAGMFEPRTRPDFFPPHGMRGPRPRGMPPLLSGPPGLMGLMFPPRGPMGMRGAPRPGIWLDPIGGLNGPPPRGPNPEDLFRGPAFEDSPFGSHARGNQWRPRDDDRRRGRDEERFGDGRRENKDTGRQGRTEEENTLNQLRGRSSEPVSEPSAKEDLPKVERQLETVMSASEQQPVSESEQMSESQLVNEVQPPSESQSVSESQQTSESAASAECQELAGESTLVNEPIKSNEPIQLTEQNQSPNQSTEQELPIFEPPVSIANISAELSKTPCMITNTVNLREANTSAPEVASEISSNVENNNQEIESFNSLEINQANNEEMNKPCVTSEIPTEFELDSMPVKEMSVKNVIEKDSSEYIDLPQATGLVTQVSENSVEGTENENSETT